MLIFNDDEENIINWEECCSDGDSSTEGFLLLKFHKDEWCDLSTLQINSVEIKFQLGTT